MLALLVALCFVLGLLIGSFLNVVIWRVPRKESVVSPPSHCPTCDAPIKAFDNIPVVSWLVLRGKCRNCGERISIRYPLVELGTGLLFAAFAWFFGYSWELPAYLYLAAIGIALSLIDLDTKRLPDVLTLPSIPVAGVLLALPAAIYGDWSSYGRAWLGALALGLFYFVIAFIYPAGMGGGDIKLAPMLGLYLAWIGWGALVVGAFLGFLLGAVVGGGLMIAQRATRKSKIPFGPFMVAGAIIAVFVGEHIAHAYNSTVFH